MRQLEVKGQPQWLCDNEKRSHDMWCSFYWCQLSSTGLLLNSKAIAMDTRCNQLWPMWAQQVNLLNKEILQRWTKVSHNETDLTKVKKLIVISYSENNSGFCVKKGCIYLTWPHKIQHYIRGFQPYSVKSHVHTCFHSNHLQDQLISLISSSYLFKTVLISKIWCFAVMKITYKRDISLPFSLDLIFFRTIS